MRPWGSRWRLMARNRSICPGPSWSSSHGPAILPMPWWWLMAAPWSRITSRMPAWNARYSGMASMRRHEDEVEARPLGVAVGEVGQAEGPGPGRAERLHPLPHPLQAVPADRALQGVGQDAEILQVVPQVGIPEPALLPGPGHQAGGGQGAPAPADPPDPPAGPGGRSRARLRCAQQQAAGSPGAGRRPQQRLQRRPAQAVELQGHLGLLRVRQPEHGRVAELALEDLPGGVQRRRPSPGTGS